MESVQQQSAWRSGDTCMEGVFRRPGHFPDDDAGR